VRKALPPHFWVEDRVGTARRRVVSVADGVTGPDLPERVELVRAALADADRGRFEQELDQALDTARSTPGPAAARLRRRGLVSSGVRPSARWCAVGSNRGRLGRGEEPEWETEALDVEDAIGRYLT
jgi:hypothetical protein